MFRVRQQTNLCNLFRHNRQPFIFNKSTRTTTEGLLRATPNFTKRSYPLPIVSTQRFYTNEQNNECMIRFKNRIGILYICYTSWIVLSGVVCGIIGFVGSGWYYINRRENFLAVVTYSFICGLCCGFGGIFFDASVPIILPVLVVSELVNIVHGKPLYILKYFEKE